jgi:molecular chaperone DnaK (HSP70)
MNLVHICRGAWEIMRKPRMIELSIVSQGAYEHAKFKPAGFAAAMNSNQQKVISQALKAKEKGSCSFCASALTLNCLSCTSQEHFVSKNAGQANHFSAEVDQRKNQEKKNPENKKMSAKQEDPASPLDAETIKAMIEQHAKNLTEACNKSNAEAVNKAVEAAREAVKLETAAIAAKVDETIKQALKQRSTGKGSVGALNEHLEPQKFQPGMVAVPSYFKELAAAAQKKRTFDAQLAQGGME